MACYPSDLHVPETLCGVLFAENMGMTAVLALPEAATGWMVDHIRRRGMLSLLWADAVTDLVAKDALLMALVDSREFQAKRQKLDGGVSSGYGTHLV